MNCNKCGEEIFTVASQFTKYCKECGKLIINTDIISDNIQSNNNNDTFLNTKNTDIIDTNIKYNNPPKENNSNKWLSNKKILLSVGIILIVSALLVYYFILKNNPEKDAKKAFNEYCDCSRKNNESILKMQNEFLDSFDKNNFKRKSDARIKLNEIIDKIYSDDTICNNIANIEYMKLRSTYVTNQNLVNKFDYTYQALQGQCEDIEATTKINTLYNDIDKKINSIINPEPDIEQIKSDLIGTEIPGWKFNYLDEFNSAEIINTTKGINRIEYNLKLNLKDNSLNSYHDCEVIVAYLQNESGWYFNNISLIYITYTYTLFTDRFIQIVLPKNCTFNADNSYNIAWKTSNWFGYSSEIKTGPAYGAATLPYSSSYYLKSLEENSINVKFTYRLNTTR